MKKYGKLIAIISTIGLIFASSINSWLWLNQPKTPTLMK